MQKLYCYVDESGLEASEPLFVVAAVVVGAERDDLINILLEIESKSGKGNVKWIWSKESVQRAYIEAVLKHLAFKGKLCYGIHKNQENRLALTVITAGAAILKHAQGEYKVTVFVDALPDAHVHRFGTELRHLHIRTRKIRGIKKEQTDALIRLADALCGFARDATAGDEYLKALLDKAKEDGCIFAL